VLLILSLSVRGDIEENQEPGGGATVTSSTEKTRLGVLRPRVHCRLTINSPTYFYTDERIKAGAPYASLIVRVKTR